jgi:quinol monooxygenase YgiN
MLRFIVSVFVNDEAKFLSAAQELADESLKEAGCVDYTFCKVDESADNEYLFVELWESDEALEFHRSTPHCSRLIPVLDSCSTVKAAYKCYEQY